MCSRLFGGGGRTCIRCPTGGAKRNFQQPLSCFFRSERGQTVTMAFRRPYDFHLLPVVRKFSAAVKTSHVRPRESGGLRTARCATNRDGKAVTRVPTTEKRIEQFRDHGVPSTSRAGYPAILIYCNDSTSVRAPTERICTPHSTT